jgi:hypothetical protein
MVDTVVTHVISPKVAPVAANTEETFVTYKRIILDNALINKGYFGVDSASVDYDFIRISDSSVLIPETVCGDLNAYVLDVAYGDDAEEAVFYVTVPTVSHDGYIRIYDEPLSIRTRYGIQLLGGETYEVQARYLAFAANTGGDMYVSLGVEVFDNAGTKLGDFAEDVVYEYDVASTVWQDLSLEVTSAAILDEYPTAFYVRALGHFNQNDTADYGRARLESFTIVKTTSSRLSQPTIIKSDMNVIYRDCAVQDVIEVYASTIRPLSAQYVITSEHTADYKIDNGYVIFLEPEETPLTLEYRYAVNARNQENRFEAEGIDIVSYLVDDLVDIIGSKQVGLKVLVNGDSNVHTWDGDSWVSGANSNDIFVLNDVTLYRHNNGNWLETG